MLYFTLVAINPSGHNKARISRLSLKVTNHHFHKDNSEAKSSVCDILVFVIETTEGTNLVEDYGCRLVSAVTKPGTSRSHD